VDWRAIRDRPEVRTLQLDSRENALNLIRIILAILVIVSHSFPIGGFGNDPALGDLSLGHLAVGGFFAISGYLITRSRYQTGFWTYLRSRALRIFPGYWACLIFTGFGAAGLTGVLRGSWTLSDGLKFLLGNLLMVKAGGGDIGSTLIGSPYPLAWNGSLWTLRYEFACYLIVGVLLFFRFIRQRRVIFPIAFVVVTTASVLLEVRGTGGVAGEIALLVPFFLAGAAIYVYADRIPSKPGLAALAFVLAIAVCWFGFGRSLAALPLAYVMVWLGVSAPKALRAIGRKIDISYGTYLYGFPIQQLLVLAGAHHLGVWAYVLLSIACTLPLAYLSFVLVERPALKLKRVARKEPSHRVPAPIS